MKKMKMMAAALTAAMAFSIAAVPALPQNTAYAAAKTVKANKKYKKAKTVKKGTTKVKCPKGEAQTQYYVKFKAPKTKTYTFVFKHYDDGFKGGESVNCGSFYIRYVRRGRLDYKQFKTTTNNKEVRKKSIFTDSLGTDEWKKYSAEHNFPMGTGTREYAKLKLKKGSTVYVGSSFTGEKAYSYQVTIK